MFGNRENIPLTLLKKDDSLALKGIALLFLLGHHLFYLNDGRYDDIPLWKGHYLVQEIGIMSKVCVALFVFLSGYGLAVVAQKNGGVPSVKEFYIRRFKKLFLNYWFIWFVFVPVSYFCYDMTFEKAYQHHVGLQLATDVLGVHDIVFGSTTLCYNPTWWFYSCIILLYLLFPLLYRWIRSDAISVLLVSMAVSFIPISQINCIRFNLVAFVLGIMFVAMKLPPPSKPWIWALLILVLLVSERNFTSYPLFTDCLICVALVQVYRSFSFYKSIKTALAFIGKHSMNIFLFHTFIFYFWFRDYIYAPRIPIVIFLILLCVCLAISVLLEWMKKYTINRFL